MNTQSQHAGIGGGTSRHWWLWCIALVGAIFFGPGHAVAQPYNGTIFIDPDIVTPADPTVYQGTTYLGRGLRTVFDRRVNQFITIDAYLFGISYSDGLATEARVNPEFQSVDNARIEAEKYGRLMGQLPYVVRTGVLSLWIHKGVELFGGGNQSVLIHTGQSEFYERDGILEETLIHEASHSSLDELHATSAGWLAAQQSDNAFISTYARDNPTREDIAESFLPYFAVRYRADRISPANYNTIVATIPNRIRYFDQALDNFTTCADEGFTGGKLSMCRQICETDQSPANLTKLIKLYMRIYRSVPHCAL